jgi:hypothetical protein
MIQPNHTKGFSEMTNKTQLIIGCAVAALMSASTAFTQTPPSPLGPKAPQSAQEQAQDVELEPEASEAVAPKPTDDAKSAVDERDARIEALLKEIEALKAAAAKSPAAAAGDAAKDVAATDDGVEYKPGWIAQMLKVTFTPGQFATAASNTFHEDDPLAAFNLGKHSFSYTVFQESTKLPKDQLMAYRNRAIFRAKEDGRHSFNSTVSLSDRVARTDRGAVNCMTEVKLNGRTIAAEQDLVGPTGGPGGGPAISAVAVGGVNLKKGKYNIEWTSYCPLQGRYMQWVDLSLEVKAPSDNGPRTPDDDMIVYEVRKGPAKAAAAKTTKKK